MKGSNLKKLLRNLGLSTNESVFFRDEKEGQAYHAFNSEIQKKINIIRPNAYYVFNKQPFILFFDLTKSEELEREPDIHRQVWSFDYSPVIFIIKLNNIQIYNAFSFDKANNHLEEILLSESERDDIFSFWNLQSGESWKWLQEKYYKNNIQQKRVNQKLFENIKIVRQALIKSNYGNALSEDDANILILRIIFIRYLIDRDVKLDPNYIDGKTIIERRKHFSILLNNPIKLNDFFEILNKKFHGVLFRDTEIFLSDTQSSYLSQIFSINNNLNQKNIFSGTDFYFEIFDFSIIPVEIISGIYESLISPENKDNQSAIYTPAFIAEYILSITVDDYLEENNFSECKIFDPSCGSGIFLVQAYRKMVDKEKEIKGEKLDRLRLNEIAKSNLFGVDLNHQALKVTCFSLYIAILDYLDPKTILDDFHFPTLLNENIFGANFFDINHEFNNVIKSEEVDFIIGNPPWKNGSKDSLHVNYLKDNDLVTIISDFQLAQSFIARSKDFSSSNTICSLVITSKGIYNTNATNFKKYFLTDFFLYECFDLSAVRRLIFEDASNPAMILKFKYAGCKNPLNNIVKHVSIKYNIYLKYYKALVIEKNDQKYIKQKYFYEYPWMFKVALYGGTLDFNFLKKLTDQQKSVGEYLKDNYSIEAKNGINKGIPKPGNYFDELIGLPIIETSQILPYYTHVDENTKKLTKDDVLLVSGRSIELFKGKKILFTRRTKDETFINISLCNNDAVFRNSAYGIVIDPDEHLLAFIYSMFISDIFTYYQYLTTSSWGIYYPEINKIEYLSFPLPLPNDEIKDKMLFYLKELLKPLSNHYLEFSLVNPPVDSSVLYELNNLVSQLFKIDSIEKDLISFALNISRYQFQQGKQDKLTRKININGPYIKEYCSVFFSEFENIYEDESLQIEVYHLNQFIALNFTFIEGSFKSNNKIIFNTSETSIKKILHKLAHNLSIDNITDSNDPLQNLYIQKDIKGFDKNSFYIIKPNEYKCWHKAMAWYDVAEIKEAIELAEINDLKNTPDVS